MSSGDALGRLTFRAKAVTLVASLFAGLTLIQVALAGYVAFKPADEIVVTSGGQDASPWQGLGLGLLVGGISILWLLASIAFVILAMMWIHRAHANIIEQGMPMDNGPGWAVGSYFIPFANLIVPFRAMRELYNRSMGEIPEHAHAGVDDVAAWWTAWLVAVFVQCALLFKLALNALTNLILYTPLWMEYAMSAFANLCFAGAALLLVKLVRTITDAQRGSLHVGTAFA